MEVTEEEYLEHFGVKGMRWGIRRKDPNSNVSRFDAARIQRNENNNVVRKQALSGKKFKVSAAIGRAAMGNDRWRETLKMNTKVANKQTARIRSGQNTLRDWSHILGSLGPYGANLFITFKRTG